MKTRRVPLIIGLVLALGTAVLLFTYVRSLRPSTASTQMKSVLVATHDIAARAAATSDLFTVEPRLASQLDSDAISDPRSLAGTYTLVSIPAGSVLTASKIGLASAAMLPARLPVGMRAVSISIDNVSGVAGLITPGDRVDVIAVPPHSGNSAPRGYAILRDALVLAMGANVETTAVTTGPLSLAPPPLSTITLAVTSMQADILAGASSSSSLRLALRNPRETLRDNPVEPLVLDGPSVAQAAPAPAAAEPLTEPDAAVAPAAAAAAPAGVTVIDGDHVSSGTSGAGTPQ